MLNTGIQSLPSQKEIQVVFEDEYCVIVSKPSNLIVHHSHFARNIDEVSLVDLMRSQLEIETLSPVHRLDRKTSGLILFAKSNTSVARFQSALSDDSESQKIYWALMRGYLPENGSIETPVKNENNVYKDAKTTFRTLIHLEREFEIPPYEKQRYSVVELKAITGRYHQLRQHANKIAHPIINDPKHGNRHHNHFFSEKLRVTELFLHAKQLVFIHPYTQNQIKVEAPLPLFWITFLGNDLNKFV